ncbi:hypothetical protein [Neobacillus terrae]|uniref:hypothetical protein n=1 Tax=Neobacillus terrae TaxID=3034837 RepID=UPI00140AE370|nr:hypothetical protein [Neobacillus terrae]NHM29672.1 hypothetical protein [Neobacillus terrae]
MELDLVWEKFIILLQSSNSIIEKAEWKKITGIPFLYIMPRERTMVEDIQKAIMQSAAKAMQGKRLHSQTVFVRKEKSLLVFRHRFYVPQKKMFCCGNLCNDCVRFQNDYLSAT